MQRNLSRVQTCGQGSTRGGATRNPSHRPLEGTSPPPEREGGRGGGGGVAAGWSLPTRIGKSQNGVSACTRGLSTHKQPSPTRHGCSAQPAGCAADGCKQVAAPLSTSDVRYPGSRTD